MFAIAIKPENLFFIDDPNLDVNMDLMTDLSTRNITWYFIRGYVDQKGNVHDWGVLPQFSMYRFDHDPQKIQHDWDQIVRKEQQ